MPLASISLAPVLWRNRDQEGLLDAELQARLAHETIQEFPESTTRFTARQQTQRVSRSTPATDAIMLGVGWCRSRWMKRWLASTS
ncbi:hypothetical protein WMF37_19035 [Sorangium sp. So ce291]|uniref:hypothetical protein n=1 Tax=Sorangium sp. So ce291 TaxID=3133294 RepID=UPI003F5EF691